MSDSKGFSLGTIVNQGNAFKALPDWVAFDLCQAYPIPGGNLLLHNTQNGKRAMVKPEVYASLLRCRQFKTLDQHVATITELNPGMQGQQDDIRNVFKSMLDNGIMLSAKNACDRLKQKTENKKLERETDAPVVAILTWERPQALERLLESIAANCDTGKLHRLYVIDDSRKPENISQNQALTDQFASRLAVPIEYFGRTEQQSFLTRLVNELPEHENAIHFLADPSRWTDHWTSGLTRNLALLLSCGRRLVMLDDDTICDLYNPPQQKPEITFSDEPREAAFFGSEQEWDVLRQPMNPDPINRHMQCLGLTVSETLKVLGENYLKPAGFTGATALQLSELGPESIVLVTECGSLGCPGTSDNTWLPDMAPASLKQMLASTKSTTDALSTRQVWNGRNQPHFAPHSNMSPITGFDNRAMLPPYLPVLRGEDRLFGYMMDFIFPTSVTLDYPWAIPHLPIPDRQWHDKDLDFKPADSFPKFFIEKIVEHKSSCESTSPVDRLSSLSAWFNDIAGASAASLTSMYRDNRLRSGSERLQHLNTLLETTQAAPVNWQNYLRNGISQLNIDLDRASLPGFKVKGLPADMESDELINFWKSVWGDFATVLKAWPEIRDAAEKVINTG
ncbi:MAG: hypothetical protein QNK22_09000 [Xanthomonadales bacterium]|nr:hypothetical protein [Xanthomonadales bacterium]